MKPQIQSLSFALAVTMATCLSITAAPAGAVDVSYSFDFEDGVVPDILNVVSWDSADPATETITCDASSGQLRVYDTVPASCGLYLAPDQVFTDVHMSAVVNSDPHGNFIFSARDSGDPDNYSSYGCWLWKSPHTSGVELFMDKLVNGNTVYRNRSGVVYAPGPYVVELDVVDKVTSQGVPYVDWTARLIFNNDQESRSLYAQDFGTLGGHDRLTSGIATFGAALGTDQRNRGWPLNVAIDNVNITATPLNGLSLPGDLNSDGSVNSTDLDIVRANWGQSVSPQTNGDADGDGVVASGDLDIVRANWGATAAASVPEPTFLALGSLAAALFLARRR